MPNKTSDSHRNETMHMMPFVEHEYEMYRASRQKNRIVCALCVTNFAWLVGILAYIIYHV
jgi:hypothetical protein